MENGDEAEDDEDDDGGADSKLVSGGRGGGTSRSRYSLKGVVAKALQKLMKAIGVARDVPFIFFAKHDDLYLLNKAVLYVNANEQSSRLIIVNCVGYDIDNDEMRAKNAQLADHVKIIDSMYPKTKISLLLVQDDFTPAVIEWLSEELGVPTNAMFISCPDEHFTLKLSQLRGIRIITGGG